MRKPCRWMAPCSWLRCILASECLSENSAETVIAFPDNEMTVWEITRDTWTQEFYGKYWQVKTVKPPLRSYTRLYIPTKAWWEQKGAPGMWGTEHWYLEAVVSCVVYVFQSVCFRKIWLSLLFSVRSTSRSQLPHRSHLPLCASSPSTCPATAKTNLKPASTASINMCQGMKSRQSELFMSL